MRRIMSYSRAAINLSVRVMTALVVILILSPNEKALAAISEASMQSIIDKQMQESHLNPITQFQYGVTGYQANAAWGQATEPTNIFLRGALVDSSMSAPYRYAIIKLGHFSQGQRDTLDIIGCPCLEIPPDSDGTYGDSLQRRNQIAQFVAQNAYQGRHWFNPRTVMGQPQNPVVPLNWRSIQPGDDTTRFGIQAEALTGWDIYFADNLNVPGTLFAEAGPDTFITVPIEGQRRFYWVVPRDSTLEMARDSGQYAATLPPGVRVASGRANVSEKVTRVDEVGFWTPAFNGVHNDR